MMKNHNFLEVNFAFLVRFCVILLLLITFWRVLKVLKNKNKKILNGGYKMAAV